MLNRLRDGWDWIIDLLHLPELLSAIADHIKGILLAAALLVLSLLVFYLVVNREENPSGRDLTGEAGPATGPPVDITDAEGTDSHGRDASFKIFVFSRDFAWTFESDKEVEYLGSPDDIGPHLRSPGLQENLRNAKALIAVGAASQEGTPSAEEARARRRAARLQRWVKENVSGVQRLHTLSMGRFVGPALKVSATSETAPQRSVVIVAVVAAEEDVILAEALRSALSEEKAFPFKLSEYSEFELSDWR